MPHDLRSATRITVFYDPLCGWCYGAAPSLHRLATQPGVTLQLSPTGLFAGTGARPLDDTFAAHAWAADARIAQLTGQAFSERYRDRVLADRQARLDSGPATLALTAVALEDRDREVDALAAIQAARYVEGRDVTSAAVLADVLRARGLHQAAARVIAPDAALRAATDDRVDAGKRALRGFGATGVPTLVVDGRMVASDALYGPFPELVRCIQAA